MYDPVRHAAHQETIEPLPPMGADHNEVVAISYFAHSRHGIAKADIGRHCEVRTRQRLGRVVHGLFSMLLTQLRPAFESHHQTRVDHMQRGDD